MSSGRSSGSEPSSTEPRVAGQTNGQLTMNEPFLPWKSSMEAFSSCVGRPALPRPSLPIVEMIRAAVRPASESRFVVTSSVGASALGTICSRRPR